MSPLAPYDAVLLLSFGGPEGPEEVMPFLRHVTAGRGIPDERLAEVAHHYDIRGGISPLNGENRALISALGHELRRRDVEIPILWGNRHAAPFTTEALRAAHEAGHSRLLGLVTSAYPSYSGCRQYREHLAEAVAEVEATHDIDPPHIDKVRVFGDHPGFIEAVTRRTLDATRAFLDEHDVRAPHLAFVTHSIPVSMAQHSGPTGEEYVARHVEVVDLVTEALRAELGRDIPTSLVYCSRSGPPQQPWLEPDIVDHLDDLADGGVDGVIVSPIGFVADHMEVVHDLDTEAAERAAELGLAFTRVPTVRDDPGFVAALADLLEERAAEARGEEVDPSTGTPSGALPSTCAPDCCPNLRGPRPALCEAGTP